jgi:hypothetical protein
MVAYAGLNMSSDKSLTLSWIWVMGTLFLSGSENAVKAKFAERHHYEGKRCMLVSL